MRIIIDFEYEFNTLVTRGKIQIMGLRDIVRSLKKYTAHTQSEAFKSAVHQIEGKSIRFWRYCLTFQIPKRLNLRTYTASNSKKNPSGKPWNGNTGQRIESPLNPTRCVTTHKYSPIYTAPKSDSYKLQVSQSTVSLKQMKNLGTYSVFTVPLTYEIYGQAENEHP